MEIKEILKFYKKRIKFIVIFSVVFAILGLLSFFYLPSMYHASGSLFVKRAVYPYSDTHFTYEGYYGQQAAVSYTDSVIGLVESVDIHARTLEKLNEPVNEKSLRTLKRKIRIKKSGPQVITINIKDSKEDRAEEIWQALTNSTVETAAELRSGGDPYMNVSKISAEPIIKTGYKNLYLYSAAGLIFGALFSTLLLATKSYFSENKK